VEYRTMILYWN